MPLVCTLLLQTAEATKVATDAAKVVSAHAAESSFTSLLWLLCVLFFLACALMAALLWRSEKGKTAEIQAAVAAGRKELLDQLAQATATLAENNKELRQQEKKTVEVIGAVANALNNNAAALQAVQFQMMTIETIVTGRVPQAPARPPAPFTPPTL